MPQRTVLVDRTQNGARLVTALSPSSLNYRVPCLSAVASGIPPDKSDLFCPSKTNQIPTELDLQNKCLQPLLLGSSCTGVL